MLEPVLKAAWEGWLLVCAWPNILYPIAGTLLAMIFAVIPGLSGVTLMALAIPFTFSWDPLPIMLVFGAFVGGATFMGSVTAILFNIPGKNSNAATLLDGHPLARKGQAKTALGCSAAASALGSSFGVLVLMLLIPLVRKSILAIGPPELLALAIWGLTTLAVFTRDSMIKGVSSAGIGLLLAFIGSDPRTAELRYTFGTLYLRDGLSLVPVFLGIFALAELINLTVSEQRTISGATQMEELSGRVFEGVLSVFKNFGVFIRSSIIGTVVGMTPGVGATIASFVAYSHAAQTAGKDRENFGSGDIRGVLAPEAANDAKDGGSLLPTLALGIPGGSGTTLLLVALTLHGLTPGREMLTDHLNLTFVLIWSMFLSNWLTSMLGLAAANPLARLSVVRVHLLAPIILVLATLGAYIYKGRIEDVFLAYFCGFVGYYMKVYGWPRIPLVIALVLGSLFENSFHITLRLHQLGRINFWTRPIPMVLLGLSVISLTLPYLQARKSKKK
jgi:TctA family transporter